MLQANKNGFFVDVVVFVVFKSNRCKNICPCVIPLEHLEFRKGGGGGETIYVPIST